MLKFVGATILLQVGLTFAFSLSEIRLHKRESVSDEGDHLLICKQEPLELGIVMDSSSSIPAKDFKTGIQFLKDFLQQYEISSQPNGVRVSIITYGKGIYPTLGFNLTTYDTKEEVIEAIGKIPHKFGPYTDTGKAIKYMHDVQMESSVVRPGVTKVGIVITDGNSQEWKLTKSEAEKARDDGIVMFAIGVGQGIRDEELLNIAGDASRVTKVDNYDKLNSIKEELAHQTCFKEQKTTITPLPEDKPCGEENPADIFFVFSPANLGTYGTSWAASFVTLTVDSKDMDTGFRYGVISGSCPIDAGFNLDAYSSAKDIEERMQKYGVDKVSSLVQTLVTDGFTVARGARDGSRKVAVIIAEDKSIKQLTDEVASLVAQGVAVFIADPDDNNIEIAGAVTLTGRSSKLQAEGLVSELCPKKQ